MSHRLPALLLAPLALLLAACGGEDTGPARDNTEAVRAYYASKPDFFIFASPEDLPADLDWQTGEEQEPFASPNAKRGGILRSYIPSFPPTLRIVGPDANSSFRGLIWDDNSISLTEFHPNTLEPIPGVAAAWAVSEDKRTVYYRLDPEARFTDGEPVTADDFFFTFYFFQSSYINEPWYNDWYSKEYTNITKYDDHTIALTLPRPKPNPLYFTSISAIPEHFFRELGEDFAERYQWEFMPTTGPYTVRPEDVIEGRSLALTRIENWWGDNKKFYRHRFNPDVKLYRVIRDPEVAFEEFRAGQLDLFGVTTPRYWYEKLNFPAVENGYVQRAVFYNEAPQPSIGIYMNSAKPLLDNRNVRLGIQHALNWQAVIETFFYNDYQRLNTTSDGYGRFTHPTITARPFDIERARSYFAEAGFTEAGPDGVLVNSQGQRLSFELNAAQSPNTDMLSILKQEAIKAGLELRLDIVDPTASYEKVQEKNHELAFMGWNTSLPYPRYWEGYHSVNANVPQTNNVTNTAIPEMDPLIIQHREATSEEEIERLSHTLEEMVHEHAVFSPGYKVPFYRVAYWAWIQFPEGFDAKTSEGPGDLQLYWIDPEVKTAVQQAQRRGEPYGESEPRTFDQYRVR